MMFYCVFFFFKQKTAYEMRISDWSSDVCSSDLITAPLSPVFAQTVDGADAGVAANEQGEVQTNEILVTANRREQNIQDIAISVSALGERDIERFNVQSGDRKSVV